MNNYLQFLLGTACTMRRGVDTLSEWNSNVDEMRHDATRVFTKSK